MSKWIVGHHTHVTLHIDLIGRRRCHIDLLTLAARLYFLMLAPDALLDAIKDSFLLFILLFIFLQS